MVQPYSQRHWAPRLGCCKGPRVGSQSSTNRKLFTLRSCLGRWVGKDSLKDGTDPSHISWGKPWWCHQEGRSVQYFCNRVRPKPDNMGRGSRRNVCSSMRRYNTLLTGPDNTHLKHTKKPADKLFACQRAISGQLEILQSPRRDSSLCLPILKWVNS